MVAGKTTVRIRLDELLADGQWHDRDTILTELMAHVPPGKAIRRAIDQRAGDRRRRNGHAQMTNPEFSQPQDNQRVGARSIARDVLNSAVTRGTIERDGNRIRSRKDT